MLTLGNVRAILHSGIEEFLEYLHETQDPLHPIRLLEDLDTGEIGIDGRVITGLSAVEKMVELSSGCICCSIDDYRFDLAIQLHGSGFVEGGADYQFAGNLVTDGSRFGGADVFFHDGTENGGPAGRP